MNNSSPDPQDRENPAAASLGVAVFLAIILGVTAFFIFAAAAPSRASAPPAERTAGDIMVDHPSWYSSKGEWDDKGRFTGTFTNVSSRSVRFASVEFHVFNGASEKLGTLTANIDGLAPGEVWRWSVKPYQAGVRSIRMGDFALRMSR